MKRKMRSRFERFLEQLYSGILSNAVFIGLVVILVQLLIILIIWQFGDIKVSGKSNSDYFFRDLLADSSEIALKLGAVLAGIIGIYKYWYSRYEPLIFITTCGLIPISLSRDLIRKNKKFRAIWGSSKVPDYDDDTELQRLHDLPIIILHKTTLELLGIKEGSKVDLFFQTPEDKAIWAIAYAYTFESTGMEKYNEWPIGVSMSLRRYFRIERPCSLHCAEGKTPEGWKLIKMNTHDLADLHASTRIGKNLVWMASDNYSVRFRDRTDTFKFYDQDSFDDEGRILEYVGISLRIMKRSLFRYRAPFE